MSARRAETAQEARQIRKADAAIAVQVRIRVENRVADTSAKRRDKNGVVAQADAVVAIEVAQAFAVVRLPIRVAIAAGAPVTVKGRRAEGLGALGREEGIAVWATAIISQVQQ